MRIYFRLAPLALAIAAGSVMAQSSDEAVAQMQQQLKAMQQQLNSVNNDRVRFNGFFSTGYSRASNDAGFDGITEETSVADQSLLALQGTFDVTEKSQAVMQLVGRGSEDWDPVIEWAYLSHRPTNNLQLRAGKMRLPFFMYSDSLEVGYSQTWARPPAAVYDPVAIQSYVGADATHTLNFDGSSLTTQVFTGFTEEEGNISEVELRNTAGLTLGWTDYVWTVRGIAATGETSINATRLAAIAEANGLQLVDGQAILADEERGNFFGIGLGFDDGTWQVISEITRVEVDGKFADTDSAYLSVARRFGAFTPYAVIGWVESQDNDEREAAFLAQAPSGAVVPAVPESILNTRRDEYSVGMRWDITPGVAIKADITHVRGFEDSAGGLNPAFVLTSDNDSTNVYTLKLDSAF
ncbi:hypothetical protein FDP08_11285 [Marinobacter panjinensis]|uniref:Porin n=1 Tax=Marinobacter panjinensis TaxID=2576384 RepID=A0A4U6R551_9GAMM|nr:hypothetical protein [Marinobacter panjinensis]MCR8914547.1 hypothetical protein [Marinobacter panjinensis]TKV68631.1 hypothetical protein FDP08_11285 [Marinobacter panjinensis]